MFVLCLVDTPPSSIVRHDRASMSTLPQDTGTAARYVRICTQFLTVDPGTSTSISSESESESEITVSEHSYVQHLISPLFAGLSPLGRACDTLLNPLSWHHTQVFTDMPPASLSWHRASHIASISPCGDLPAARPGLAVAVVVVVHGLDHPKHHLSMPGICTSQPWTIPWLWQASHLYCAVPLLVLMSCLVSRSA